MRRECRECFSRHRIERKPLVSDPGMHHDTCITHVPWCMSGSLTRSGGENVHGIPGACATRNFRHLARGSCWVWLLTHALISTAIECFLYRDRYQFRRYWGLSLRGNNHQGSWPSKCPEDNRSFYRQTGLSCRSTLHGKGKLAGSSFGHSKCKFLPFFTGEYFAQIW